MKHLIAMVIVMVILTVMLLSTAIMGLLVGHHIFNAEDVGVWDIRPLGLGLFLMGLSYGITKLATFTIKSYFKVISLIDEQTQGNYKAKAP